MIRAVEMVRCDRCKSEHKWEDSRYCSWQAAGGVKLLKLCPSCAEEFVAWIHKGEIQ